MPRPLNTILYGPPGTGKTYATLERCVRICDREEGELSPERVRKRFDELVDEKRVEFVTFHQSYGYEEFVEGLRPETGLGGGLWLKVRDGVLKRITERARNAPLAAGIAPTDGGEQVAGRERQFFKVALGDGATFAECMRHGCVRFSMDDLGNHDYSSYRTQAAVRARVRELHPNANNVLQHHDASSVLRFRSLMSRGDVVVVPKGPGTGSLHRYVAVGEVVGQYRYDVSHNRPHRRDVRWLWKASGDASRSVGDFQEKKLATYPVQVIRNPDRPDKLLDYLPKRLSRSVPQPHVLVIDEINRANVAKVLGELITLLEDDKREGAANELAVTLPHSGDRFTLPSNLHVLGTMNTADRSIALLDTALRRRFAFEELAPDPSLPLLKDVAERTGVDVPAVLRAINERLEWLVDRDHLIGHAWFLGAKSRPELDEIMRRKVIPLIAEYFYDDWEKVRAVLGGTDAFVRAEKLRAPPGIDIEGETRYRWTVRTDFPPAAYAQLVGAAAKGSAAVGNADPADPMTLEGAGVEA